MRRLRIHLLLGVAAVGPSVLNAQAPDTAAAIAALRLYDDTCERDGGALWGVTLCGPIVLVHAPSRLAVANAPDPDGRFEAREGAWVGTLPADKLIANTAIDWAGQRWAMALLPLPDSAARISALLAHESFHRIQPQLALAVRDPPNPHLAERDGRVWLRLELRALAAAVRAADTTALRHLHAALLFRAARHVAFPGADTLEAALELNEGLAEYTGIRVAYDGPALTERVAALTEAGEKRTSFVRSLGYVTGPALGILLDRYAAGWQTRVASIASLSGELGTAVGLADAVPDMAAAVAAAGPYGYAEVASAEDERAAEHQARLASYRRALIDGPIVELRTRNFSGSFNPNQVVPLPGAGTVYPTGVFQGEWGRLEVFDGALVTPDFSMITVAAPATVAAGSRIDGPGWTLQLAPGWALVAGTRAGSYVVAGPEKE